MVLNENDKVQLLLFAEMIVRLFIVFTAEIKIYFSNTIQQNTHLTNRLRSDQSMGFYYNHLRSIAITF